MGINVKSEKSPSVNSGTIKHFLYKKCVFGFGVLPSKRRWLVLKSFSVRINLVKGGILQPGGSV